MPSHVVQHLLKKITRLLEDNNLLNLYATQLSMTQVHL